MAIEETEIQRIERELEILRMRANLYERSALFGRIVFAEASIIGSIVIAALVLQAYPDDPLYAGFAIAAAVLACGILWFVSHDLFKFPLMLTFPLILRIAIVRSTVRSGAQVPLFKIYPRRPEPAEIQEQITSREARLAELQPMPVSDLPVDMQIANLEHRLAFLKERLAGLTRMGKVWLVSAAVLLPAIFATIAIGAYLTHQDIALALFLPLILLLLSVLIGWLFRGVPLSSMGIDKSTNYWLSLQASIETCERQLAKLRRLT